MNADCNCPLLAIALIWSTSFWFVDLMYLPYAKSHIITLTSSLRVDSSFQINLQKIFKASLLTEEKGQKNRWDQVCVQYKSTSIIGLGSFLLNSFLFVLVTGRGINLLYLGSSLQGWNSRSWVHFSGCETNWSRRKGVQVIILSPIQTILCYQISTNNIRPDWLMPLWISLFIRCMDINFRMRIRK